MIDIHSHVLWGVDDGAATRDVSIAMLKLAAETGTTDIVATPHSDLQFEFQPSVVMQRIQELSATTGGVPRIHRGCDFHMSFENVQACLRDPSPFTINGKIYLLVEFADTFIPPSTEEIFRQFAAQGITPIITHPERNPILQTDVARLTRWIASGCLLQVTAQALTDRFGKAAQKSAWTLLRNGMVHVIASDGHDPEHRPPRLDHARELLTREMGADAADLLLQHNPLAIIEGQRDSPKAVAAMPGKNWFQFWK